MAPTPFDVALADLATAPANPPATIAESTAKLAAAMRKLDMGAPIDSTKFLRGDGSWNTPPGALGFTPPDDATAATKGVLKLAGDLAGTADIPEIASRAVTLPKLANIASDSLLGRSAPGSGAVQDLTISEVTAMLDEFDAGNQGVVPASGGGTSKFLRADGSWAEPAGTGGGSGSGSNVLTWIGW